MLTFESRPGGHHDVVISYEAHGHKCPVTEVYAGPEEYSSAGPYFGCDFDCELYEGSVKTVVVRTWKHRQGDPNNDPYRDYERLRVFTSTDGGRSWELRCDQGLGALRQGRA